jgi:hypothetical protein
MAIRGLTVSSGAIGAWPPASKVQDRLARNITSICSCGGDVLDARENVTLCAMSPPLNAERLRGLVIGIRKPAGGAGQMRKNVTNPFRRRSSRGFTALLQRPECL